jgi:hypothetical protein
MKKKILFLLAVLGMSTAYSTQIDSIWGNMGLYNNPNKEFKRFVKISNLTIDPIVKVYYDAEHTLLKGLALVNPTTATPGKWINNYTNSVYIKDCVDGTNYFITVEVDGKEIKSNSAVTPGTQVLKFIGTTVKNPTSESFDLGFLPNISPTSLKVEVKNGSNTWNMDIPISLISAGKTYFQTIRFTNIDGSFDFTGKSFETRVIYNGDTSAWIGFETPASNGIKNPTKNSFSCFPNPATSIINIPSTGLYTIYSSSGQIMLAGNGSQIDVSKIPNGVYIIKNQAGFSRFEKE